MIARTVGYVLRADARLRVDAPGALAAAFGVLLFAGLAPPVRRRFPWLAWGSLIAAAASGVAFWLSRDALRWEVTVDERGVRLVNGAGEKIDLGVPTSVREGRHEAARSEGLIYKVIPHHWVAVETDAGRVFVFESAVGLPGGEPNQWPQASPPETPDRFSSFTFDLAAFRAALWTAMLR